MKKMLQTGLLTAMLTLAYFIAPAQEGRIPKWVSGKGYWVVEGNVKTPRDHTIRFYTNENLLVYTETLKGVKLNANKRKIKMKLKKALESAIIAWENKSEKLEGMALVKNSL